MHWVFILQIHLSFHINELLYNCRATVNCNNDNLYGRYTIYNYPDTVPIVAKIINHISYTKLHHQESDSIFSNSNRCNHNLSAHVNHCRYRDNIRVLRIDS